MAAFVSPLKNLANWTLTLAAAPITMPACLAAAPATPPTCLRYAGYVLPVLQAANTSAAGEDVQMPATGILRRVDSGGLVFVEVQVNPFPIRRVASKIPGGLPTFYFIFANAAGLTFMDGDEALGGEKLRSATGVSIAAIGQDRQALDPRIWSENIRAAIAAGSGDSSLWAPFAQAISAAIAASPAPPVLIYNHAGQILTNSSQFPFSNGGTVDVDVVITSQGTDTAYRVPMMPLHNGDLQQAVQWLHARNQIPFANLWDNGVTSFRLRPVAGPGAAQLVRLDDGLTASGEIQVTKAQSGVAFTNLNDWFAPQFTGTTALARFIRGNLLTPFVNGPEYFNDLFPALRDAQATGCGLHLAGWSMRPQTKFFNRDFYENPLDKVNLDSAMIGPDRVPVTLEQAAQLIGAAGGKTRFLPSKFYQLLPGETLLTIEALGIFLILDLISVLNILPSSFLQALARTDTAGYFLLALLWVGATLYTAYIIGNDGKPIEPNKDAIDTLSALTKAMAVYAPYPARVEDNSPAPNLTGFPFSTLFKIVRNFGVYHQKFAIVKTPTQTIGYCGGIDLNVDRLDDVNHLQPSPFHDVHARIEGNAVRDLAISFEQRWQHDAGNNDFAFQAPQTDPTFAPGTDIIQIGRTYFAPAPGATRGFSFAPNGDRTIHDTILQAIMMAEEFIYIEDQYLTPSADYQAALVEKVTSREIKQLIITVPGLADQPFGEGVRDSFVNSLITADGGAGILRVGYPRRRFASTNNTLRASAGKLLLMQNLAASGGINPIIFLGPPSRLPDLPFWVSIEGELIYVYDESTVPNRDPDSMKVFACDRGASTNFVCGGSTPVGTSTRTHQAGAAATVIDFSSIYVHAKIMIVDDVFLSLGSANLDRRGFFYDGEINAFTIPAALRASPRNPAMMLRKKLWAEMLDLPAGLMAPLLTDPLASAPLFDRSPFVGNRYTPLDARPPHLMVSLTTGDGAIADLLQLLNFSETAANRNRLFMDVIDPASRTESP
jgi:phosphatidylserine/phosphatidylglycerophosphate/cardiolipin synthase-like enzyme